jgi:hypothetical protein
MTDEPEVICGFVEPDGACEERGVIDIFLEPGVLVRHPDRDDWGLGQVQSVAGVMVTVNFEDAGKQTINAEQIRLKFVGDNPRDRR